MTKEEYNKNPKKCLNCDSSLIYEKKYNKFCGSSCSAIYNNKIRNCKPYVLSETGLKNIIKSNKSENRIREYKKTIEQNYYKNPKLCKNCESVIPYEKKRHNFCSDDCKKLYLKINVTEDTRKKLSNSLKNFYKTDKGLKNIKKLSNLGKEKEFSIETRKKLSNFRLEKCKDINERIRLREIGRKGGFGKKGHTEKGTRYDSCFEKECFEYLEKLNINFIPHKSLPESSKMCDIYLPDKDIWIELDGVNREKRKKYLLVDYEYWLDKLNQYKEKGLKYEIFYSYEEFINYIASSSVRRAVGLHPMSVGSSNLSSRTIMGK